MWGEGCIDSARVKVLIKLAATWEGIAAMKELEAEVPDVSDCRALPLECMRSAGHHLQHDPGVWVCLSLSIRSQRAGGEGV